VDPELSRDCPLPLTGLTGMDALTQLIEPYVSLRANPLTDALCQVSANSPRRSLQCLAP